MFWPFPKLATCWKILNFKWRCLRNSCKLKLTQKQLTEALLNWFVFRKISEKTNLALEVKLKENEKKYQVKIGKLEKEISSLSFELSNIEDKLRGIFTDGQIKKLKNGNKRLNWTQNDIASSITLFSASSKCYRLLRKKNFPLPAVRTLQHWAEKLDIQPGVLKPVIRLLSETKQMSVLQKLCVFSFDEMKIREAFCYDKKQDTTLSPAKYVQVGMLRGKRLHFFYHTFSSTSFN